MKIYEHENILKLSGNMLINLPLYGNPQFDSNKNTRLLNAAIYNRFTQISKLLLLLS